MVTTVTAYTSTQHRALAGAGWDGVVRVSYNGSYGTGALLYGGKAVLTAAHLFADATKQATVHFETAAGSTALTASGFTIYPVYDAENANGDLALVWLGSGAPKDAERYDLYRDDATGQLFDLVGYGQTGTGSTGAASSSSGYVRLKAGNRFDAAGDDLASLVSWQPEEDAILVADFDDGSSARDALGLMLGQIDLGQGDDEGLTAPGDSGGPAFIDDRLAGVASYTAALSTTGAQPDIDSQSNSSFGELGFWQRAGHYAQWIDQTVRAAYTDAPATAVEVRQSVSEGSSGSSHAYFMIEFSGLRPSATGWISVDYATRDGTASAGSDYLAASGTLVIYPDETRALIPVEILGDTQQEADETFYLDVSNPVGGDFGPGILTVSAVRTITNDDTL